MTAVAPAFGGDRPPIIRLCVIATIGKSVQVLYAGRLEHLAAHGFEITVGCASSEDDDAIVARGVRLKTFAFTRAITPWQDLRALVQLYRFFREERFDLVEVSTPKGALIGSVAAWLARCPYQIHILHGMPYEGKRGLLATVLQGLHLHPVPACSCHVCCLRVDARTRVR